MNNHHFRVSLLVLLAGLGIASQLDLSPRPLLSEEAKPTVSDSAELESSAKQFEAAFNKGDASAIAAQLTTDAEVIDDDGTIITGRDQIQARFAELFKAHPKAKTSVEVSTLRQLGSTIAVEEGTSVVTLDPDQPSSRSPYSLIQVRKDGKWLIARIRDFPEEATDTPHDHLQSLAWLVGDWVDQSGDTKVETNCKWDEGGNFLIQNYVVKTREGNTLKGSQRIGWDAQRKSVRSWAFDQSGSFVESIWTPVNEGWIINAEGCTADGQRASATRIVAILSPDLYQIDSTQRLVGDELLEDATARVARRPPPPVTE